MFSFLFKKTKNLNKKDAEYIKKIIEDYGDENIKLELSKAISFYKKSIERNCYVFASWRGILLTQEIKSRILKKYSGKALFDWNLVDNDVNRICLDVLSNKLFKKDI